MLLACKTLGSKDRIKVTSKKQHAYCPGCNQEVISKCGTKKRWHWSHKVKSDCNWYSNETEWHRQWKSLFSQVEVYLGTHRADAIDSCGRVWEFQNSYLSKEDIDARESFHDNLLWIWIAKGKQKLITFNNWQLDTCYQVSWWKQITSYRLENGEKLFENYGEADDFRKKMIKYGWTTDIEAIKYTDFREGRKYQVKQVLTEYETSQNYLYALKLHTNSNSPEAPLWLPKNIKGLPSRWWWQHTSMAEFCKKPILLELEEDLFFAVSKIYKDNISTYTDPEYGIRLQYNANFTEGLLFRLSKKELIESFEDGSIIQLTLF